MPPSFPLDREVKHRSDAIDAAMGRTPCDLILRGARYLDVFSCQWRVADVAVAGGVIVGLDSGLALKAQRERDARGKWLVPGFIDAHVHVESSLMVPGQFEAAVLPRGTTTAICDPHELANVLGPAGIQYFLEASGRLSMDLWVMMSSCVPATHMETNGGGEIGAETLAELGRHPRALGLAEMMNVPGVLGADPEILRKLQAFTGRPVDGHCPLLSGQALSAYAAAGIGSCHESSRLDEAEEKLRKGLAVWIREGSVAKDLDALAPLLTVGSSTSIGFCTDDRNPLDIAQEGHIDHLVRGAIRAGVPSEVAYRASGWSVARHYGLHHGPARVGAVAPGFAADLVLLGDEESCAVEAVWKRGVAREEIADAASDVKGFGNSVRAVVPEAADLEGPAGSVHVIRVMEGKILTEREVSDSSAPGVARLTVLERHGRGRKPANGYVAGFGAGLRGAIASSVGHDSHNLIAVGDRAEDLRAALASLVECGGGFSVVRDGAVLARLPLPLGGLMAARSPAELSAALVELKRASRSIGCELAEPFLQLAFLSLPVIPRLKLTDHGLVDVEAFRVIDVRAS
jgi:adenine deaminase